MNIRSRAKKKLFVALFLTGLIAGVSCEVAAPTKGPKQERPRGGTDAVSIFLTGNVLGTLKPCGCSGGQLGGLDRRPAIFNAVPRGKRLVLDTGSLVRGDSDQELIKYSIIMQAMGLLDYDLVNLTEEDLETARNLGLLDSSSVTLISPYGTGEIAGPFQKQYVLDGENITISIATFDPETSPIEQVREFFPARKGGQKDVNILIISGRNDAVISSISQTGIVDCIICPAES
ncbi:MAG: hypothetical protein ABIF19_12690, partial [Planctomycetota bacterium]